MMKRCDDKKGWRWKRTKREESMGLSMGIERIYLVVVVVSWLCSISPTTLVFMNYPLACPTAYINSRALRRLVGIFSG